LDFDRKFFPYICGFILAVKKEGSACLDLCQHVISFHVRKLMACKEVGRVDKVWAANLVFAKAKVRNGKTAGLFGVV
jgi:hypothetical protein